MHHVRDQSRAPARKAVNLSIDTRLLAEARAHDINLSATLEGALAAALRQARRQQWLAENQAAIEAYNAQVDAHGAFADSLRSF